MAVPLRIGFQNLADSAVLSASSASGSLTVGKLLIADVQDIWRAASSPAWFVADLGTAATVGAVGLMNSNAIPSDAVRLRVSSADPTGAAGDVYDTGSFLAPISIKKRLMALFIEPAVSGRYVRIDLSQASAPEVGRLYIGPTWTPTRNRAFGAEPAWRDWSSETLTRGLNLIRDRRARQKGFSFSLRGLTQAEVDGEIETLNEDIGTSADILVCLDVDQPATKTIWGPMAVMIRSPQPAYNFHIAEFTVWNRL